MNGISDEAADLSAESTTVEMILRELILNVRGIEDDLERIRRRAEALLADQI